MRFSFLLSLPVLFCALSPAFAAPLEVQAMMQPDGSLRTCRAETSYEDRRKMALELAPDGALALEATIPSAGFVRGRKYDLAVTFDEQPARNIRALALNGESVLLPLGAGSALQRTLAAARKISLGATAGPKILFPLTDMNGAIKALNACLAQNKPLPAPEAAKPAPEKQATPPLAPKAKKQKADPAPQESSEDAFPEPLAQLLADAGLKDIKPLPLTSFPQDKRPADYLWQTGAILGGVREREVPPDYTLSKLLGIHMQGLKEKCAGTFRTDINKEQSAGPLVLRTALASCAQEGQPKIYVGLVFYLTKKNVFTAFTHEGTEENKAEILATRNKLAKFLLALAVKE